MKPISILICIVLQMQDFNNVEAKSDLYLSIPDLNTTFQVEKLFVPILDTFITSSNESVNKIKISLRNHIETKTLNFIEKQKFLIHVRCDLLQLQNHIKRFKSNLKSIRKVKHESIPDLSDLKGIVRGLQLIQKVYNISADNFAEGKISNTIRISSKLSASDCFQIGLMMKNFKYYSFAIDWFQTARKQLNIKRTTFIFNEISKLKINEEIDSLRKNTTGFKTENYDDSREISLKKFAYRFANKHLNAEIFELAHSKVLSRFCTKPNTKTSSKNLFCEYQMKNHPFLILAPLKAEIYNFDPYMVVFHDVISNDEIEFIKNISSNNMLKGTVFNANEELGEENESRISKVYFIDDDNYRVIEILNQRIEDISGLSIETAEKLQVATYGIGGHYGVHHDFFNSDLKGNTTEKFPEYWLGDRIATVLFYMSDVKYGGATIWPFINTSVFPKKGSAVFWYNLYKCGLPNFYTVHSACPVVIGSKWVLTKWFRSKGQEFRKPCGLYPDYNYDFFPDDY